ncbi:unnamed protein product [Mesocestoides corti]|uniref:IRS-type PTB domain-containing protein n=1 Tax=Mesocestoides corti TaxID=53468 RepID=A0A158QV54_MESCO|nr:unnamed protein product [Mesocestoides corti]
MGSYCKISLRRSWHNAKKRDLPTFCDINEIDDYLTENQVYEKHGLNVTKVRVLPTELAVRLQLHGIVLFEIKDYSIYLLDYITMSEINRWHFKAIRSFGFNKDRLYILTGSHCVGGRGLLILESENCADITNSMICVVKSLAGESEPPSEVTDSPLPNAVPNSAKKSMQDLSASLQDFCRAHCCSLPPLKNRTEGQTAETDDLGSNDHPTRSSETANVNSGNDDDNLSLDEFGAANSEMNSLEVDLKQRFSLSGEVEGKVRSSANENFCLSKEAKKLTLKTSVLRKSLSEFFSHGATRGEVVKSPLPPSPTLLKCVSSTTYTADCLPHSPNVLLNDRKSHSLVDTQKVQGNDNERICLSEQKHARRTESAKAVQLIKWRDLSEKEDYCSSASKRVLMESPEHGGESDYRGSDLVVEQQLSTTQGTESPSMQEEASLPSSSSTARNRQLEAALRHDMIAFTAF